VRKWPILIPDTNEGWNGGAVGIPYISGNGHLTFTVPVESIGVLVGFSFIIDGAVKTTNIEFGFLIGRGFYEFIQHGEVVGDKQDHVSDSTEFIIERNNGMIYYKVDGAVKHVANNSGTVSLTPISGAIRYANKPLYVDSALYLAGDKIVEAEVLDGGVALNLGYAPVGSFVGQGQSVSSGIAGLQNLIRVAPRISNPLAPLGNFISQNAAVNNALTPLGNEVFQQPVLISPAQQVFQRVGALENEIYIRASTTYNFVSPVTVGLSNRITQGQGVVNAIAPLGSVGYQFIASDIEGHFYLDHLELDATLDEVSDPAGFYLELETLELTSGVVGQGLFELEQLEVDATIVGGSILSLDIELPSLGFEGSITRPEEIEYAGLLDTLEFTAYGAATFSVELPQLEVAGEFTSHDIVQSLDLYLDELIVSASAEAVNTAQLDIELPQLELTSNGLTLDILLDELIFLGAGASPYARGGLAYVYSVKDETLTTFSNYNFDKVITVKGVNYGVKEGSLYKLETSDTDDGSRIFLRLLTHLDSRVYNPVGELVESQNLKVLKGLRLVARSDRPITARVIERQNTGSNYLVSPVANEGLLDVYRCETHRGPRVSHRQYGVYCTAPFVLRSIVAELKILKRKAFSHGKG